MASANKKVDNKGSAFNLINSYNQLVDNMFKSNNINYVKNQYVKDTVINDNSYYSTYESLAGAGVVDLPRFNIVYWDFQGAGTGWTLDETELSNYVASTTKEDIQELENIPINLSVTNYLTQTINVPFKKYTEYIYAVTYQVVDGTTYESKSIGLKDLSLSFTVNGAPYSTSQITELENIGVAELVNSSNYTYIKYIYFKNLNDFEGHNSVTIRLNSSAVASTDRFVIKNVVFTEGVCLTSNTKKNDLNFSDYVRFNEKKKWEITNDGSTYNLLNDSPLKLKSILVNYTDISAASDHTTFGVFLPRNASIVNITIESLTEFYIGAVAAELRIQSDTYTFKTGTDWKIIPDHINSIDPTSQTYPYYPIQTSADDDPITGINAYDPIFTITSYSGDLDTLTAGSFYINVFYLSSENKNNIVNLIDVYYPDASVYTYINSVSDGYADHSVAPAYEAIYWVFESDLVAQTVKTYLETYLSFSITGSASNDGTYTVSSVSIGGSALSIYVVEAVTDEIFVLGTVTLEVLP